MADMVKPIDSVAERDEVVDNVHVPPGVFAKPVDDKQHGFCFPFWKPSLMKDVGVPHALETAFDMIHKVSLFQVVVEVAEHQPSAENDYGPF
jgi:hypothetical protein